MAEVVATPVLVTVPAQMKAEPLEEKDLERTLREIIEDNDRDLWRALSHRSPSHRQCKKAPLFQCLSKEECQWTFGKKCESRKPGDPNSLYAAYHALFHPFYASKKETM